MTGFFGAFLHLQALLLQIPPAGRNDKSLVLAVGLNCWDRAWQQRKQHKESNSESLHYGRDDKFLVLRTGVDLLLRVEAFNLANVGKLSILGAMKLLSLRAPLPAITILLIASATAQITVVPSSNAAPVSYASLTEVNGVLSELNQASQTITGDLGKLRVEKWKTDGDSKRQSLANVESIQRNLQSALPGMVSQLSAAPDSLSQTFKVYRNVGALYDVLANLAESAGAFGSKDEFQNLSNDASSIEKARRDLADRMDKLAAAKDTELANLHTQVQALQAATPPAPPTKIVIDDNEKPKKPVKRKAAKPAVVPVVPKADAGKPAAPAPPKPQ